MILIFSFTFTPLIPPSAENSRNVTVLSSVIIVSVELDVEKPIIRTEINTIAPTHVPTTRPLLLLILAAIYPPTNTLIASIANVQYSITPTGGRADVKNSIVTIHNNDAIVTTDATTPSMIALQKVVLLLLIYDNERKKITSDTNVFRGELFYYI